MLCAAMYAEYFQHTSPVNSSRLIRSPVAADRSGEPVRWNQSHAFALQAPAIRSPRLCWRLPTGNLVAGRRTGVFAHAPCARRRPVILPAFKEPTMHDLPTYDDVIAAAARIAGHANRTPVMSSRTLDEELGAEVFFKCENLQRMGRSSSAALQRAVAVFRRAACRRGGGVLLRQPRPGHRPPARLLGIPATIVMPADAPAVKIEATRGYGGQVVLYDRYTEDREQIGRDLAQRHGLTLIPPLRSPRRAGRAGHRGQELFEEVGPLDAFFAPSAAAACSPAAPWRSARWRRPAGSTGWSRRPATMASVRQQRRHRAYRYAADPRRWRPDPAFGQSHLPADPAQRR